MKKVNKNHKRRSPSNSFLSETNSNDIAVSVRVKGKTKRIRFSGIVRSFKKIRDMFVALGAALVSLFRKGE